MYKNKCRLFFTSYVLLTVNGGLYTTLAVALDCFSYHRRYALPKF